MGNKNITVDVMLEEMLESIGDREEPRRDDGWYSFAELMEAARGFSENQMRDKANRMVSQGKWERRKWGRWMYYRVMKC